MPFKSVAFDGNRVHVEFHDNEIGELLEFLFSDIAGEDSGELKETFIVERDKDSGNWRLFQSEKSLFNGQNVAGLGVVILGEVLFHLIKENDRGLAIHAGLVSDDDRAILMPGHSGAGKTY